MKIIKNKRRTGIIIMILFALFLTMIRFQWVNYFQNPSKQPVIENGELDLRDWDFSKDSTLSLDGEWVFFPYELLERDHAKHLGLPQKPIQVPGNWSNTLNPTTGSPYGYGSYHLRIFVNPDLDQAFSIQVPSVRSSSALYVNGLFSGASGEVADNQKDARAFNVPYLSSSIRSDEAGVIDIVLQATNFEDPRSSGFVRSMRFGDDEKIRADIQLSTLLQVLSAIIFIVHALFAIILFIIGIRDTRLLYFALVLFIIALMSLMSGDEKVLFDYVELSYTLSLKLAFFVLMILGWAMVHCVKPQIQSMAKFLLPFYTMICFGSILIVVFLPLTSLGFATVFSLLYILLSAMITALALVFGKITYYGSTWLALSVAALCNHIGWWIYTLGSGVKVMYYPFDLLIAVICIAGVWFKNYHKMQLESKYMEVAWLQAQIQPHFIFNALNTIKALSDIDLKRMQKVLESFSELLKAKFKFSRLNEMIPLENELAIVKAYLSIEEERFGPRLQVNCDIDDNLTVRIPSLTIQPLVENAVHHGIMKRIEGGQLTIRVVKKCKQIKITIEDNGIGMDKTVAATLLNEKYRKGNGIGLLNTDRRLKSQFGQGLEIQTEVDVGTKISFIIPKK